MRRTTRSTNRKLNGTSKELAALNNGDDNEGVEGDAFVQEASSRSKKRANVKRNEEVKEKSESAPQKKKGRLQTLPSMPLDILFEVFAHLSPGDLVRLSRASKAFRELLLSKQAVYLWKDSFALTEDTPPCPNDMTELAWANLLFGGPYCHMCGARGVRNVQFSLRRRLCNTCITQKLVCWEDMQHSLPKQYQHRFFMHTDTDNFPFPLAVIQETRKSKTHYGVSIRTRTAAYVCEEDIEDFIHQLDIACADLTSSERTHYETIDQIVKTCLANQTARMQARAEHTDACYAWQDRNNSARAGDLDVRRNARRAQILSKLAELEYTPEDAQDIWKMKNVFVAKRLTDKAWAELFPTLKATLNGARDRRLEIEKHLRKQERLNVAKQTYWKLRQSLPPSEAPYLPFPEHIKWLEGLKDLLDEDILEITNEWRDRLTGVLVVVLEQHCEVLLGHRVYLESLLTSNHPSSSASEGQQPEALTSQASLDRLALATSVFKVQGILGNTGVHSYLWGDEILARPGGRDSVYFHDRSSESYLKRPTCVALCTIARATVLKLLDLLGLDTTTTALALDQADHRFVCTEDPINFRALRDKDGRFAPVFGRESVTWRGLVHHAMKNHPGQIDSFRLLTEAEHVEVKLQDSSYPAWNCCRCPVQPGYEEYDSRTTDRAPGMGKEKLMLHIEAVHNIPASECVEGSDYFWNTAWDRSNCMNYRNAWLAMSEGVASAS